MASSSAPTSRPAFASLKKALVYGLFFLQLATIAEAGNACSSLNCFSSDDDTQTQQFDPPASSKITCTNPAAPKTSDGWNIYKATTFPTVQNIVDDLKLCGIVTADDATTLFYSFAGKLSNAQRFQKANPDLNAKQINDVMPGSWYDALGKFPGMASEQGNEQMVWVARSSQALAKVSKGKVYLVASPTANIYTTPFVDPNNAWKGAHNVWYDYEFGTLQENTDVTGIYTVNSETLAIDDSVTGSWVRDRNPQGDKAAVNINADTVTADTIAAQKASCQTVVRRGDSNSTVVACAYNPSSSNTGLNTTATSTTLSAAASSTIAEAASSTSDVTSDDDYEEDGETETGDETEEGETDQGYDENGDGITTGDGETEEGSTDEGSGEDDSASSTEVVSNTLTESASLTAEATAFPTMHTTNSSSTLSSTHSTITPTTFLTRTSSLSASSQSGQTTISSQSLTSSSHSSSSSSSSTTSHTTSTKPITTSHSSTTTAHSTTSHKTSTHAPTTTHHTTSTKKAAVKTTSKAAAEPTSKKAEQTTKKSSSSSSKTCKRGSKKSSKSGKSSSKSSGSKGSSCSL